MDVIAINRYYGWYNASGHTEVIHSLLSIDLNNWYSTHGKPMLITEYGAGSIAGMHEVSCFLCSMAAIQTKGTRQFSNFHIVQGALIW